MGIEDEWDELEQVGFRKSIRGFIDDRLPEEGFAERLVAFSQLRAIVTEEIARSFRTSFSYVMEHHPKDTETDAKRLVPEQA